jgi:phosphoribosylamine--glycine ligase
MNILILGSGGREHTLAWKISQSRQCSNLYIAPGNAGTLAAAENVALDLNDFDGIAQFIRRKSVSLLIIGPEAPLVGGIRDYLTEEAGIGDLLIVGPGKAGAILEGSKDFAKAFMQKHGIPAGASRTFGKSDHDAAQAYIRELPLPIVLKADGLAAGKGVIICETHEKASKNLKAMLLDEMFGAASSKVVIEEFLSGIELSVFVLTDGVHYKLLPEAKDYKPIGENNTGPNTGGMGSVSPVNFAAGDFMEKVEDRIIKPTIRGLIEDQIDYQGFIFFGLMNVKGEPYVIEYNVRMGDPEAQVVLPRIENDFVELMQATAQGTLDEVELKLDPQTAATVILASGGYPGSYKKGIPIQGLSSAESRNTMIFHAGTKLTESDVVTNGGRVLAVTGMGQNMEEALQAAYHSVQKISWNDMYYRKDIGQDLMALEKG